MRFGFLGRLAVLSTALLACLGYARLSLGEGLGPVTPRVWQEAVVSVSDLDRSARFFTEIGGYEVKWRGAVGRGELEAFGVPASASAEALLLGPADASAGLVRLVRFEGAGPRQPMRPGSRAWDTGCYFSLMVRMKDMQSVYDDAISLGWWTETPITYLEFGESKLNVVIFQGPDGLQVQAYERLSPALPAAVGDFERMTRPFNIMQMVRDRDAAYSFFTDILGFATFYNGKPYVAEQPEYMPLGIPYNLTTSVRYRAGIVYPTPGEFGRMEMIEIMDLDGRDYSEGCRAPNLGILAVRFEVDSLDELAETLHVRGGEELGGIVDLELMPYGGFAAVSVYTPDGALIQFIERE
ncbi:MAG: hypothetical protein AAGE85_09500 [Pseudomonadota bacterium]